MGAYVLCKGLLCGMTDIETTEIHSYLERSAFFQTARNRLHRDTHELTQIQENGCRGGNDKANDTPRGVETGGIRGGQLLDGWSAMPVSYWRTGYRVVLPDYRRHQKRKRESRQFRDF